MLNIPQRMKIEIKAFSEYLPLIETEVIEIFDKNFHAKLNHINEISLNVPKMRQDSMKHFYDICFKNLNAGTMYRHSREKPFGYPGDYLIIDYIYTKKVDSDGTGRLWDEFYHRQAAPQAVRNRKKYFIDIFHSILKKCSGSISVLNLASGPCRDVAEAISKFNPDHEKVLFHCVDFDKKAIEYAKGIIDGCSSNVSFILEAANAFKLKPSRCYDLVWSAGLFDYLDDRYAAALLKRMWG